MKTLIFDGNNAVWRLQKKLPTLTANEQEVQVVYGFLRLVRSSLAQFEPNVALVCWDLGRSAHRIKLFKEYKSNRDHVSTREKRVELIAVESQIEALKKLLQQLNIAQMAYPNTEADDLIGIACNVLKGDKVIVSSDRDVFHLVDADISVWSPAHYQLYTQKNFFRRVKENVGKGLTPQQWLEFRAITGDRGDGIPGVAVGLGEETALDLISRFGSIEELYTSAVEKKASKLGNRHGLLYSEGARERAYRNLSLMDLRICINRDTGSKIAKLITKHVQERKAVEKQKLRDYFIKQKFESLLKEMPSWISPFEDLDTEIK